ncbi:MAG: phosphoserine phosphatase SerB, partial [Actinobacteria bacterium]|nr:phosphoserine phosphatase SerB [Actinomycetota bacterium]
MTDSPAPSPAFAGPAVRPLVVLDCDSTTIQDEVIELLADAAGTRELVAEVTERAMRGELDFAESLRERVATLAGTPESVFEQAYRRVRPTPGIDRLVAEVHARGGLVAVVSGGFHEVLDPLAVDLALDRWRANRLEVVGGELSGRTVGPVIDAAAKAEALREWAQEAGIPLSATMAIGDGANDLKMME